jgi:L-threonylcarbamoyladenylate synthase
MIYNASQENIQKAAKLIRAGTLVAFPTETVYGLGANALSEEAVLKIFEVKNRPAFNPLIVHLHSSDQIPLVAETGSNPELIQLITKLKCFWPGPLSLVLPRKNSLPACVSGGLDSVAVRIPAHPVAIELLKESSVPVAAPSANPSCYVSPTTAKHVEDCLGHRIEMILDGGSCKVGLESTVLSLLTSPPVILRPGVITSKDLKSVIGEVRERKISLEKSEITKSPGMSGRHYCPRTRIILRSELRSSRIPARTGLISFQNNSESKGNKNFIAANHLSSNGNLDEVARGLFAAIQEQDKLDLDLIVVDTCEEEGLGLAIMDRLKRAAAGGNAG